MVALPIPPVLLKKIKEAEGVIMQEAVQNELYCGKDSETQNALSSRKSISSVESKKEVRKNSARSKRKLNTVVTANEEHKDALSRIENSKDDNAAVKDNDKVELKEDAEESGLVLRPLGMKESEVNEFLGRYQSTVPKQLLESYSPCSELLEASLSGYEPYWLCLADKNQSAIKGLAVFHLDSEAKLKSRVMILHASVTDEENLSTFLKDLVTFIWRNVNCEEIRVGIAHIEQENSKCAPYLPLKTAYQALNFRWKTLANNENGKRTLILGLGRQSTDSFLNPR
eukprot:TRINITY_DN14745_c0_g5_i1.p1 TRINITY_DN14745_c0_g5~~TRINITY_DN14745_c0_g5_i1.p1  ORF type:complete len:284 (-),score=71.23 TRINITY_DN14745_c0_g5_i1:95-946(-)